MTLKKAKCPNCGEISDIDIDEFNVVCFFCGVPYKPSEGIECYNRHLSKVIDSLDVDTVNVNTDISNYALLGIASLKENNHEKCGFYADDILKRNPLSPEGLLLKAFFVSNNYSKEDGIKNYLLALDNTNKKDLIDLIMVTLKNEMKDYSKSNFDFLFNILLKRNTNLYQELMKFALMQYFINNNEVIEEEFINFNSLQDYFGVDSKEISFIDEKKLLCFDDFLLEISGGRISNACDLSLIKKDVEKYFNKKNGQSITYYLYLDEENIVNFNYSKENSDLENYLNNNDFHLNTIKGGCYIASCVYGSYNSEEVWILRRFRDQKLAHNIFGRIFIKTYYFLSPILLKLFSRQQWFISLNRKMLNRFVDNLKKKGYSSEPYKD